VKKASILLAVAGVALGVLIVVWLGAGKVVHAVLSVGWSGFALLVGWQLLLFVVLATAWHTVCPGARLRAVIWGRLVREGAGNCLPFSEIGGLALGARAVTLGGVPGPRAIASSIADVTAEFMGEIPFILFGSALLMARKPESSLTLPLVIGIVLLAAGMAAMIWAEKHSAALFHSLGRRVAARWVHQVADQADEVEQEFNSIFAQPRRLGAAAGIHLVAWIGGGISIWITYHLLGGRIGVVQAIGIEGLLSGALSVAFLVPGGIGVQEVSYVALGRLFGMPAHMSLGLSLLRRARDIVIGAPALLTWQAAEARRLRQESGITRPVQGVARPRPGAGS
jgi:glycosyltransferase 2 family protein